MTLVKRALMGSLGLLALLALVLSFGPAASAGAQTAGGGGGTGGTGSSGRGPVEVRGPSENANPHASEVGPRSLDDDGDADNGDAGDSEDDAGNAGGNGNSGGGNAGGNGNAGGGNPNAGADNPGRGPVEPTFPGRNGQGNVERRDPSERGNPCPPASGNPGGDQPCGPPQCPPASGNPGGDQPCGNGPDRDDDNVCDRHGDSHGAGHDGTGPGHECPPPVCDRHDNTRGVGHDGTGPGHEGCPPEEPAEDDTDGDNDGDNGTGVGAGEEPALGPVDLDEPANGTDTRNPQAAPKVLSGGTGRSAGVVAASTAGAESGSTAAVAAGGTATESGTAESNLAFTGLDSMDLILLGLGLIVTGRRLRRLGRSSTKS